MPPGLSAAVKADDQGEPPGKAIALARLVGFVQQPLQAEEDWQQFEEVWEKLRRQE